MKIKTFFFILLPVLFLTTVSGQKNNKKIVITGLVTDSQIRPVSGGMILIDNKNTNIITNDKGLYKIRVLPGADSITIISFNNGISTTAINGRTTINFTLGGSSLSKQNFQDKSAKDEVVNIGYGNVKQKDLLTPVNTIDGRSGKYAGYKDIYEILKGPRE